VPTSRLGRLFNFGLLLGDFALSGAATSLQGLLQGKPGNAFEVLFNPRNGEKLAKRFSHLRGAAMKMGQLLSMESADLLPPAFTQALALLRSDANPMPLSQLRRLLGREYGKGWQNRFSEFDFEPLAAASIGQVHRARTSDGRDLALKIQYPGVARSIDSDVNNVALLLRLANVLPVDLDVAGLIAEAKRQLRQEADYLQEAGFLEQYRELVADEPSLHLPCVHADFSTRRILAMDFVEGVPLETLTEEGISQTRRDAIGEALEQLMFRELFEFRCMQTDPNFANYLLESAGERIVLLDFGSVREFSATLVEQYVHLCRAIIADDRTAVRDAAFAIGYLSPDDPGHYIDRVVDLMILMCEPLRHQGPYDFAGSELPARARTLGFELAFQHGFRRAPPPETMFLHRKLVGSFLLCARIRARVDVQALLVPFLDESRTAA